VILSPATMRTLELIEYVPTLLPRADLMDALGELLWERYSSQIDVEFPSPKTKNKWELTSRGWVGYIPLSAELGISIHPKVPLRNLFGMWEYAYRLKGLFPPGQFQAATINDFYSSLASILARQVLERCRKGIYRNYLPRFDQLPYVRGRLDVPALTNTPWATSLACHYEEHTPDIEDNQLLAWTLFVIAHSGFCKPAVLPTVLKAYRTLQGSVSLRHFSPAACINRLYNRLNEDYGLPHALCRFFLEQSGPTHQLGSHTMLPFLISMAQLFELFLAEWLAANLPPNLGLQTQERVSIGQDSVLQFRIDLVLYDKVTGSVRAVLDTKYKTSQGLDASDAAQIIAYAKLKNAPQAILIYPAPLAKNLNDHIGDIHLRTLTFSLHDDLQEAGQLFLSNLLSP
jgi:5-methylcytosine-specific restriction enzyme subunit McrC